MKNYEGLDKNFQIVMGFLKDDERVVTGLSDAGLSWGTVWSSQKDIKHFEIAGTP